MKRSCSGLCNACRNCPFLNDKKECDDAVVLGYCYAMDYGPDYSTAFYEELNAQNGEL